ncbi:MAG: hypothetical protein ABI905_08995 [Betaproteobacteria bacterium]
MNCLKTVVAAAAIAVLANSAHCFAGDLGSIGTLTQAQFLRLSTDLGAAASYKGVTPATPLGTLGIDVGLELTQTQLETASAFRQAGAGNLDDVYTTKLHVTKGLPFGFDIGAFIGRLSDLDGTLIGGEMRYAVLDDGLATPAVGVRLSGTKLTSVSNLSLSTVALDAMVSKKLAFVTPYIGGGVVRTQSSASTGLLREEKFNKSRVFVGVNANFLLLNIAVEAEKMSDNTSLSAKAGFRF